MITQKDFLEIAKKHLKVRDDGSNYIDDPTFAKQYAQYLKKFASKIEKEGRILRDSCKNDGCIDPQCKNDCMNAGCPDGWCKETICPPNIGNDYCKVYAQLMPHQKVSMEKHNKNWASIFKQEKSKIQASFTEAKQIQPDIEHIGSTSIPGISAKPIVDMMFGFSNYKELNEMSADILNKLGYIELFSEKIINKQVRRFFVKNAETTNIAETSNQMFIHLFLKNGILWTRHKLFRDYLIANNEVAKSYEKIKIELAQKYPNSRSKYQNEKRPYVDEIHKKAALWNKSRT